MAGQKSPAERSYGSAVPADLLAVVSCAGSLQTAEIDHGSVSSSLSWVPVSAKVSEIFFVLFRSKQENLSFYRFALRDTTDGLNRIRLMELKFDTKIGSPDHSDEGILTKASSQDDVQLSMSPPGYAPRLRFETCDSDG